MKLGIQRIPNVRVVKEHNKTITKLVGSRPEVFKSALGNIYCKTNLSAILEHVSTDFLHLLGTHLPLFLFKEMANPTIREQLYFYPEDSGSYLAEARQAQRWLSEVDPIFAAVMARAPDGQDYFVDEPVLANIDSFGTLAAVLPVRFYTRRGLMYAKVHRLTPNMAGDAFIIHVGGDADCFELPLSAFFMSYPRFKQSHQHYGLPTPDVIAGLSVFGS